MNRLQLCPTVLALAAVLMLFNSADAQNFGTGSFNPPAPVQNGFATPDRPVASPPVVPAGSFDGSNTIRVTEIDSNSTLNKFGRSDHCSDISPDRFASARRRADDSDCNLLADSAGIRF